MISPPRPFLCRSPFGPGESLFSLLIRLASLNRYPLSTLLGLCFRKPNAGRGQTVDNVDRPLKAETYHRLAVFTGLPPARLYAATVHRFAPTLVGPQRLLPQIQIGMGESQPILDTRSARSVRPKSNAQFCPACLKEAAYHRLIWTPVAIAACLHHEQLLVDCCPTCGGQISLLSIVATRCEACSQDLTTAEAISVQGDAFGLFVQRLLQVWLREAEPGAGVWVASIPQQPTGALHRFLEGLVCCLLERPQQMQPFLHAALPFPAWPEKAEVKYFYSPSLYYTFWATAFRALIGWPEGFFEFLDLYHHTPSRVTTAVGLMGTLYEWLVGQWRRPSFDFVWQAYTAYRLERKQPWPRASAGLGRKASLFTGFPRMPIRAAARLLNLPLEIIERLITVRELSPADAHDSLRRAEVLALHAQWRQALSLEATARWLGVSPQITTQLAMLKALPCLKDTRDLKFNKPTVCRFLHHIHVNTYPRLNQAETEVLTLTQAAQRVARIGGVAGLLKAVARGKVKALAPPEALELRALRFRPVSLTRWANTLRRQARR